MMGKALFRVPHLGYAAAAAKQPLGFLAIIAVQSGIIITEETFNIIKEIKKMKTEKAKKLTTLPDDENGGDYEGEEDESESEE